MLVYRERFYFPVSKISTMAKKINRNKIVRLNSNANPRITRSNSDSNNESVRNEVSIREFRLSEVPETNPHSEESSEEISVETIENICATRNIAQTKIIIKVPKNSCEEIKIKSETKLKL